MRAEVVAFVRLLLIEEDCAAIGVCNIIDLNQPERFQI